MSRRRAALLLLATVLPALPAAARPIAPEAQPALPLPPIPPANPPSDVAAPVPDRDILAPVPQSDGGVSVRATLDAHAPTLPGGDPVPGTLYRSEEEQRRQFIPNPGVIVTVPLEK